jgi:hypothetical protein
MNKMQEIWSGFKKSTSDSKVNIPLRMLENLAEAINANSSEDEVLANVVTATGVESNELIHALYLLPLYGNGYNYRYIEFFQPIDSFFPVHIVAFQSGNSEFGVVSLEEGEDGIYEVLKRVFSDERTHAVFTQLKSMGNTMRRWKNEDPKSATG